MDYKIVKIEKHDDKRGKLIVFLQNRELKRGLKKFGQTYFITFKGKGVVRGNHYHKKWREWFGIVDGRAQVELEDVKTKKHVSLILSANHKTYRRLEIGPYVAHSFKSLSKSASLLNYADKEWSSDDTFFYKLL